jgi:hypothetical protein
MLWRHGGERIGLIPELAKPVAQLNEEDETPPSLSRFVLWLFAN